MSNQVKGGRKPIAQKTQTPNPYAGYYSQSFMDISDDLRAEIESKGLEMRWIDAKEFMHSGNMHKHHWKPYKRTTAPNQGAAESHDILSWTLGNDAEGYIRRRGAVLAVRPKELGDAHRAHIAQKTERLHGRSVEQAAEGIKETARRGGVKTSVDTNFDE